MERIMSGFLHVGELDPLSVGCEPDFRPMAMSPEQLWNQRYDSNVMVIGCLRECDDADEIHEQTLKDASLGSMSWPVELTSEEQLRDKVITPRMPTIQEKDDGS